METVINNDLIKSNKENIKEMSKSQSSIHSNKSLEKTSSSGSTKLEKTNILQFKVENEENDNQKNQLQQQQQQQQTETSLKVPHKFISNWKQACDRTKDRTKDLLKRWRTLPDIEVDNINTSTVLNTNEINNESCGWSVHVWTTWVDRFSIDSDANSNNRDVHQLTAVQIDKFSHFFTNLLDHDNDNLISENDFEVLIERLRHFADWSINSPEFNILREVERGFIQTFLSDISDGNLGFTLNGESYLNKDGWLSKWSEMVSGSKNLYDFPVWLQYFVKVLFQVINRSGTGNITKNELTDFYSSVLGLNKKNVEELTDIAFLAMTSNGDHPLRFQSYRLCFSNYLLGRYPNGPGQYILGAPPNEMSSAMFPVDYSALNAQFDDLELYTPDQKSNRRSIIV